MATYAIGDVQGCAATLSRLLRALPLELEDEVWFTGDLVNRGPASLEVLRCVRSLPQRVVVVLGNHDLHLLGRAAGVAPRRRKDTLDAVLDAEDRDELLAWLRERSLVHREGEWMLVHAGLLPAWSPDVAIDRAREAEMLLQGERSPELLGRLCTGGQDGKAPGATPLDRAENFLRVCANLRVLDARGLPAYDYSGPADEAPFGLRPWYENWSSAHPGTTVVCGHWAAQGFHTRPGLVALDSGVIWGGPLTAMRLDDRRTWSVRGCDPIDPGLLRQHPRR